VQTSNEKILDRYIKHQTYLLRYAGGLRNEVLPALAKTETKLQSAILEWVSRADGDRTLTGTSGRKWQKDFEDVINGIRRPAWDEITLEMQSQMKELAVAEAATGAAVIQSAVPVTLGLALPPAAQLVAIVNSQPFQGRTLKGWMERTAQADVDRLLTATKIGITQGQTPTDVARSIVGSRVGQRGDAVARKAFRDTESVILTITNGIQNEAKQALYEANADIIKLEQYVATLDVRTTLECAANDGKIFERGKGPMPPLHFRCRSLRVPAINADALGNRGFDSATEKQLVNEYADANGLERVNKRADLPRGTKTKFDAFARKRRRQLVGQVPAQTNYNDWLKTQTPEFQDQVLGKARADMFRNGDISLDKFIARDGDTLTLDQLKQKGLGIETPITPRTLTVSSFDTKDFTTAAQSFKTARKGFDTDLDFIASVDPALVGVDKWPDLSKLNDKDLASVVSNLEMVVVNTSPGGKPKRYINAVRKKTMAQASVSKAVPDIKKPKAARIPKEAPAVTVTPETPIKAKQVPPVVRDLNIRHDSDVTPAQKKRLERLTQEGFDLFPQRYVQHVAGTTIETSARNIKGAEFSFRDKFITVHSGVRDADYITHELFHVLDDKFSKTNLLSGTLSWDSGDSILDDLAQATAREFLKRKTPGMSTGRLVGNKTAQYFSGDWDDWYEAVQYHKEKISPEYLTVGAQRYITRTPRIEQTMREKQPALFKLMEYLYRSDDM